MRGSADVSPSSLSITAFKPRQVILLQQQQQRIQSASAPMAQLKPEDDSVLTFSVALWLQNKGFAKVLKRFVAAAQIQDEDWTAKALNLNEIFSKYQELCNSAHEDLKSQEKQEEQVADVIKKTEVANGTTAEEIKGKKKKKSKDDAAVDKSGKTLEVEDTTMTEKINESYENGNVAELAEDQSTKKPKEKKKKKSKLASQSLDADVKPEVTEQKHAEEDEADESKKASKKRKRMAPAENENQSAQEVEIEESKSKKSKGLEGGKDAPPQTDEGTVNNNEMDKSSQKKSASKQPKSSEPNTVKAFQRVKIEEVEYVDERLQDNSYWAKDGAETGYGAKAQEILGQVKGRGFRHEKTKKKRGSYRGGQIDLNSHSVKFQYSDGE